MNAKEEAKSIVNEFRKTFEDNDSHCAIGTEIDCALIAVDLILNYSEGNDSGQLPLINSEICCDDDYWQEVKQEIEKL